MDAKTNDTFQAMAMDLDLQERIAWDNSDLSTRLNILAIDNMVAERVNRTADEALTRITELEDQKAISIDLLEREIARLNAHNGNLVAANNGYLNRARTAENELAAAKDELTRTKAEIADIRARIDNIEADQQTEQVTVTIFVPEGVEIPVVPADFFTRARN